MRGRLSRRRDPTAFDDDFDDCDQLFIDPGLCIECGACVPVCPSDAIFIHSSVPAQWQEYIELNRQHYQLISSQEV